MYPATIVPSGCTNVITGHPLSGVSLSLSDYLHILQFLFKYRKTGIHPFQKYSLVQYTHKQTDSYWSVYPDDPGESW